ncbi:hypothetical protein [Streptomyces sp. NPDC055886]
MVGDERGWWDNRGFLTNLASSFTSLLFGVPVALLVLSRLADAQAEATLRRQVMQRASGSVQSLHEAVMQRCRASDSSTLAAELLLLRDKNREMQDKLSIPRPQRLALQDLANLAEERNNLWDQICRIRLKDARMLRLWMSAISRQWAEIEQVRARATEAGMRWLPSNLEVRVSSAVERLGDGPHTAFSSRQETFTASLSSRYGPSERQWSKWREETKQVERWLGFLHDLVRSLPDLATPPQPISRI